MTESITEQVRAAVGDAVERYALGDDVEWDVVPAFNPDDGGLFYVLAYVMPSPILGQFLTTAARLNAGGWSTTMVDMLVTRGLEQLRSMRTQQLSAPNGQSN